MPSAHATLSPSGAERWLQCPASIRMEEKIPRAQRDKGSVYAAEGTKAHALAEIRARRHFGQIDEATEALEYEAWRLAAALDLDTIGEMEDHVQAYIGLLEDRLAEIPNAAILFEQRMPSGIPNCWGTSDTVIVSPSRVEIWDLKYGAGIAVSAKGNPQLRLYALGALDTFGDMLGDTEVVRMGIFQPRVYSNGDNWDEMTAQELRDWRESILPVAEEALGPDAHFGPSEEACRWCPAAGICKARTEYMVAADFGVDDPEIMTPAEVADVLPRLKDLRAWADAVETAALDLAYTQGKTVPGYKVVLSGGIRKIADEQKAVEVLAAATERDEADFVTFKIKGLGDLEKILRTLPKVRNEKTNRLRAQTLEDVIPELLTRTPGVPALAREDDKRPAIDPYTQAAEDFR